MKKIKITYWIATSLFCLFFLMDGVMGLMRIEEGQEIMKHLGYPIYLMTILGTAKVLGSIAIIQNKFKLIKEWAYAGFTFHFIGAAASRYFGGDDFVLIISPFIFMAVMLVSYFMWKKMQETVKQ